MNQQIKDNLLIRILITVGSIMLIRFGTLFPVPGINHSDLSFYIENHSTTKSLVSTFSGNNTFVIGLFTLSIFPYINSSILLQLILGFSPELAKLQKEGDLEGKRQINKLTRGITLIFAIAQSSALAFYLKQILFEWNYYLAFEIIIWLTTGAMIVLWFSELITDYGLGNGASLIIYSNIVSSLPNLSKVINVDTIKTFSFITSTGVILTVFIALYGIILLQEGVRLIPILSSKQLNQSTSLGKLINDSYLPIRFNQAGVMPIIVATTLLIIPNSIVNLGLLPKISLPIDDRFFSILYWSGYFLLILIFSSFYSTIVLNPKDVSDQLQKMSVTVSGYRPGNATTFHLKQVMNRISLLGAIILATLATIPNIVEASLNITNLNGLSTTSLLILAGVVLDILREVNDIYFSKVYTNIY